MDPLTPTTSTLSPAISHIAETARSLAGSLQDRSVKPSVNHDTEDPLVAKRVEQQGTVRWVLGTPKRLQSLYEAGDVDGAKNDWEEIEDLLRRWNGVAGVTDLRNACLKILENHSTDQSS